MEVNNTITKMKKTLEGINSRITEAEEQKWGGRHSGGITATEQRKTNEKKWQYQRPLGQY